VYRLHNHTALHTRTDTNLKPLKPTSALLVLPTGTFSSTDLQALDMRLLEHRGDWNARTGRQPTSAFVRKVHIPIKLKASFVFTFMPLHLHSPHPDEALHTRRTSGRKCQRVYKEKRFLFRKEKQKMSNTCQTLQDIYETDLSWGTGSCNDRFSWNRIIFPEFVFIGICFR